MKRILCIVGSMNAGGAETFLMKLYRNMDRTKYQMDFCVTEEGVYDKEILLLGGRIFNIVPKSKGMIKSFISIKNIVKEHQYKYVMRVSQHSLSGIELLAAKLGGAKRTIFRSSNTQTGGGVLNRLLHKICLPITMFIPNVKIAPSTEAADFMFGKKSVEKRSVLILPNALDTELYIYKEEIREQYRKALQIEDKFVVGHIGRLTSQKNHKFLLDVFFEIKLKRKNAILLLVGKGELQCELEEKVEKMGLKESVLFLGVRSDVPQLLSAMDLFVFPSFFEGMPNTIIEAQTSGVPCLISDAITPEAAVTDMVEFCSLNCNCREWSDLSIGLCDKNTFNRKEYALIMREKGYDISSCVDTFIKLCFN